MTDDTIIKLAREADPYGELGKLFEMASLTPETLKRFAELVAAEEREACAKVCEEQIDLQEFNKASRNAYGEKGKDSELMYLHHASDVSLYNAGPRNCADAIRARGASPKGGESLAN